MVSSNDFLNYSNIYKEIASQGITHDKEMYLEPWETSIIEIFPKTVNVF